MTSSLKQPLIILPHFCQKKSRSCYNEHRHLTARFLTRTCAGTALQLRNRQYLNGQSVQRERTSDRIQPWSQTAHSGNVNKSLNAIPTTTSAFKEGYFHSLATVWLFILSTLPLTFRPAFSPQEMSSAPDEHPTAASAQPRSTPASSETYHPTISLRHHFVRIRHHPSKPRWNRQSLGARAFFINKRWNHFPVFPFTRIFFFFFITWMRNIFLSHFQLVFCQKRGMLKGNVDVCLIYNVTPSVIAGSEHLLSCRYFARKRRAFYRSYVDVYCKRNAFIFVPSFQTTLQRS